MIDHRLPDPHLGGAEGGDARARRARRLSGVRDHAGRCARGAGDDPRSRSRRLGRRLDGGRRPLDGAAQKAEASDASAAAQHYLYAWRLYTLGRWPVMSAPNKRASYDKAQAAFAAYGRLVTPAIEPLSIPFEGTTIKAWLQKPAGVARPPVTINIGGSDLWKDSVAIQTRGFLPHGIAAIAVDKPGTADAPVPARPGSERMISAIIDFLQTRERSRRRPRDRARAELGQLLVGARRLCRGRAAQGRGVPERAGAPLLPARMATGSVQDQGIPVRLCAVAAAHAGREDGRGGVRVHAVAVARRLQG